MKLTSTATLAAKVRGPVLVPADPGYDKGRSGFQTAAAHRPDVIVGATGPQDIVEAVSYAKANGMAVAVQCTGHTLAAVAGAGGLLIETTRMRETTISLESYTATVAAGTVWGQVTESLAQTGRAPLSGTAGHIGVVPYTLAGGIGILSRRFGYAADHVRSLEVVTADGRLRRVSATADPDLFWALRGGRDNFGIVTHMTVDLMPVDEFFGGALVFDDTATELVLDTYVQWSTTLPDSMSASLTLITFPDIPAVPQNLRGRRIPHIRVAFLGPPATGTQLVAPLRGIKGLVRDTLTTLPYTTATSIYNEPTDPMPFECDTAHLDNLDGDGVRALLDALEPGRAPQVVDLRRLGGRLAEQPEYANAVGRPQAAHLLVATSLSSNVNEATIRAGHERLLTALAPWSTSTLSLNFANGRDGARHTSACYSPDDYRRLTELKRAHDPDNLFRMNHNIPPSERLTSMKQTQGIS